MREADSQVVIYRAPGGSVSLEVKLQGETVWLDAHHMARLFDRDRTVIVRHIRNIYQTKELDRTSTCAKNAQVAADGKVRLMDLYNLDMIISVGYRVNSKRGTQFRIWATSEPLIMMKPEELWTVYAGNSVLQTSSAWKLTTA